MLKQKRTLKFLKAAIWRWVDLTALALTVSLLCIMFQPVLYAFGDMLNGFFDLWHWSIALACTLLFSTIVWFIYGSLGGAFLRCSWRNPPLWPFSIVAFIGYVLLKVRFFEDSQHQYGWGIVFVGTGITLGVFTICGMLSCVIKSVFSKYEKYTYQKETENSSSETRPDFEQISKDFDKLVEWIERDKPISSYFEDRFDMAIFSWRIVKILRGKPLKTIGLIGPYGCGKSSILKMAEDYLKNPERVKNKGKFEESETLYSSKRIILCFVSGWGFSESTAAEHILQAVIKELSKHTDCIGLSNLPKNYRHAMADSGNFIARILAALLSGWQSPRDVLKKIDAVLYRIDKRLIVFLEDIDRNRRTDMFFNEITALLDELKELEYISFVLAIGEEHKGQEVIIKTAEHIEVIPNLPHAHVVNILKTFRTQCLEKLGTKVNCIPNKIRDERMGIARSEIVASMAAIDKRLSKPVDYIVRLLDNPRVLKAAIRRTLLAWDALCGEIDFDDLFVATVLRCTAPDVFFFINQNIEQIRSLIMDRPESKDRSDKSRSDLHVEFNVVTEKVYYDIEAVEGLMLFLFPGWSKDYIGLYPSMREPVRNYQRVENSWPTDYWNRLNREEFFPNEVRDQNILMAINEWNKNISQKAYNGLDMRDAILASEEVFDKLRQFREKIEGNALRKLAETQFANTLRENGKKANSDNCPAVNQWWLLMPENLSEDPCWIPWLLQEIYKAIPVSLKYVNDLYSTWFRHFPALRNDIIEKAKSVYDGKPEKLIEVLDPDTIGSICIFAYYYSLPKQNGNGFEPEKWKWLAKLLLDAGNINPKVIIPQISTLLCEVEPIHKVSDLGKPTAEYVGTFQEERAKGLFNNFEQLIKLLVRKIDISNYDTQKRAFITAAQQYARQKLSKNEIDE